MNEILLLAQAAPDGIPTDIPYMDYINFGVLGVFFIGVFKGWVVTGREKIEIETARNTALLEKKEAEAKFEEYQKKVHDEILPQLFETTRVLGQVTELLTDLGMTSDQIATKRRVNRL